MENFWKEYTIFLKEGKEYCYDIQNKNTNCVIIRNHNISNIKTGLKPHAYEVIIKPNRTGLINRPFSLRYVYLLSAKPTPVSIIETVTQNPINNFIHQKITKNNIVQNTPKIYEEDVYKTLSVSRIEQSPPVRRGRSNRYYFNVTLDCGAYGRPLVNIVLASSGYPTQFSIGFSNDNINYFYPYQNLQNSGNPYGFLVYFPPIHVRDHIVLINAFRYVRLNTFLIRHGRRGHRILIHITGTRCQIKNIRNKVVHEDGS